MSCYITAVNLSAIDLNLLWLLHAVLTERSVTAAAKKLNVTAPAVSNGLARLRGVLNDPLFVRKGRGLVPTPRALELEPVLAQTFAHLESSLEGTQRFDPRTCDREFTIALSDADQIAWLPRLSVEFGKKLPRARLRIVSLDTLISSGGLAGELVDLTVGPPERLEGVKSETLYEEAGVYVARKGHPRVKKRLTRELFNTERHVDLHLLLGKAGAGHRFVEDALARAGLVRNIAVVVPTFFAAACVVASTDLLSGMPLRVAKALKRSLNLEVLDGPAPPLKFQLSLHWHLRTDGDPAVEAFRQVVRSAARFS